MTNFPMIDLESTGLKISELMTTNKISINDIMDACGFNNPNAIYKWKRGECVPSIDNLLVLSKLFNTTIDNIIQIRS